MLAPLLLPLPILNESLDGSRPLAGQYAVTRKYARRGSDNAFLVAVIIRGRDQLQLSPHGAVLSSSSIRPQCVERILFLTLEQRARVCVCVIVHDIVPVFFLLS